MEGTNQESPLKLPLAPIVSSDRLSRNTTFSARRGSSIFSPEKTLDHHPYNNNNNHTKLNLDPSSSDSNPPHVSAVSGGGGVIASSSRTPTQIPQNPPPPAPPREAAQQPTTATVRHKECLKNHAANIGGHALDGCGEFMPGGEEGTPEYLSCAACDCHRNFHRKESVVEGGEPQYYNSSASTFPTHHLHRDKESLLGFAATTPRMMSFGGNSNAAIAESSGSEDLNGFEGSKKKRFRTKFSEEQKEKMQEFASKLGWRIQRQDDGEVTRFCDEVGVRRQVFKVWMHNNKQAMKRKLSSSDEIV